MKPDHFRETTRILSTPALDAVIMLDPDGKITFWNQQAVELTGWKNEVVGSSFFETIVPTELRGQFIEALRNHRRGISSDLFNRRMLIDALKKGGDTFPSEITIVPQHESFCVIIRVAGSDIQRQQDLSDLLIESFPGIFYLQDREGRYLRWNKNFETISGYSPDEIRNISVLSFFLEKDLGHITKAIDKVFKEGSAEIELEAITKHGLLIPFFFKARVIDYLGRQCLIGTAIDISDFKKAQDQIVRSEEKYRSLFEQASDPIMVTNFNGKFLDVNESLCRMFGYTKEELLTMHIFNLIEPEQVKTQPISFDRLAAGEHVFSKRKMIHRDGHVIEVEANVKRISNEAVLAIARDITPRLRVERELAESENRLRVIFETDPECIKLVDAECRLVQMNPAGLAMIEADSSDQVFGHSVIPLLDPEYREPFQKIVSDVFKGHSNTMQFAITGLKGTKRWMEMNVVPLRNKDGKIINALSLARDITERKQAEEDIRLSEAKYKLLFNKNPFPMWMLSLPDLNIIDVNDSAIAQYGYTRKEFLSMTPLDLRPDDERDRYNKAKNTEYRGINNQGIWKHMKKDGSIIKVEIVTHDMLYEGHPTRLVLSNDVTERLLAEDKLKESEFRLRRVMENQIIGVAWASPEGRVINANETFCKMLGYSLEELKGVFFGDFTHPEDTNRELALIKQIIEGKSDFYQIEKRYKTKQGEYTWVELNLSMYRNSTTNNIEFFIGFVQNINERKKAQEELIRSREELRQLTSYLESIREEERTNIAREIHDELGQQLTALKMDASWLNKKIVPESNAIHEKISGMISLIDDTVNTIRRISTDLRPGILDDLGLIDALQWQSSEFGKRTGIKCRFISSFHDSALDKKLTTGIFRVYQETLTNVARHAEATEIISTLLYNNGNLVLKVTDNGKGFSEIEVRTKKTLGLIGMKERANMFGGKITVQSELEKGTTICLEVPVTTVQESKQVK